MCVYLLVKCAFVVRFLVTMLGLKLKVRTPGFKLENCPLDATPLSAKTS